MPYPSSLPVFVFVVIDLSSVPYPRVNAVGGAFAILVGYAFTMSAQSPSGIRAIPDIATAHHGPRTQVTNEPCPTECIYR